MKIAHISDIHIRFGSRHEEYRQVFEKLYKDLKKIKPDRIVLTGDLNHFKINMSPGSLDLSSEFLINLAKITSVDIIAGNHDMNMQQLEQGDTISPIIKIINKTEEGKKDKSAFIVNEGNVSEIDFSRKAIYYYEYSGLYNINDSLVYGVFSCKDEDYPVLKKKEKDKKYIALFHGPIYGARGDNGYLLQEIHTTNLATFEKYDIVMMGDIHEHQSFERYEEKIIDENELDNYIKKGWEYKKSL